MEQATAQEHFPNRLRKHREIAGFTQKEVAKRLGFLGTCRISLWESGFSAPCIRNLTKLSLLYKTSIDELFAPYRGCMARTMDNQKEMEP